MNVKTKPENSTWTDEQWAAIATRNTSILVSAGAGSGKTAVLTERILEILKEGHSILDLIVLTFTNAAAKEMKERVKQKLEAAIQNGYDELKPELQKIDLSDICTFDSFSLNLVKKYHYLLGIENDLQIGDSIFMSHLKKSCMEQAFQTFYEKEDALFFKLLDTFTVKDDKDFQKTLLKVAESLTSRIHMIDSLEESYQNLNENYIGNQFLNYEKEIQSQKSFIKSEIDRILEPGYSSKLDAYLLAILMSYMTIYQEQEYNEYAPLVSCFSLPSFPRSKDIDELEKEHLKEEIDALKKEIQKLKDLCVYPNKEEYISEVLKTKDTVFAIKELLITYFHLLEQEKKNCNYYEFHDIGRFAIQLLEENESIRKQFQEQVFEIMIDEYQDTNDIGTYFVSMIQNHNVYTVGDVKQSIYRFRNANPNIFMERFYRFQKNDGGKLITLSKNFRSRKEVVDGINLLFQAVMDEQVGGVHYHNQEEMIFGNLSYEKVKDSKTNYEMEVLDYEYKKTTFAKTYRKEEIEAFLIGTDIKKRIEAKEKINDHGTLREVTYSDFAILQDRKTSFDLYKKIFTYLGIPLTIHKEEPFRESDVIDTIKSILKLVLYMEQKRTDRDTVLHPFLSLSRSFLGGITDPEIFSFLNRCQHDSKRIFQAMKEDSNFSSLYQKLEHLKGYSSTHTIYSLLQELYHTFHIYDAVIQLGDISLGSDKLVFLLNLSQTLETMGYDLEQFVSYFETMEEETLDITFQMNQESNIDAVTMMTIHKSKGLEFPICYFSGLTKLFSKEDTKERFIYNQTLGIITPFFEEGIRETFYKKLFVLNNRLEDISERIRVFYVALTRAKEKMIFVAPLSDVPKNQAFVNIVPYNVRKKYQSFFDILSSVKELLTPFTKMVSLDTIPLTHSYDEVIQETLDFKLEIPLSGCIQIQEEKRMLQKDTYSMHSNEVNFKEKEKMKIGTEIHEYLECIDFHHFEESLKKIPTTPFIKDKIRAFYEQPFMREIQSYECFPEYEFLYTEDEKEAHGIIDLLLVSEKHAVVVDYKLKNIQKKEYEEQVRGYMNYIKKKLKKPVIGYIYSILDETKIEVI